MNKNINFTYGGSDYTITLTTKEDSFHYCSNFQVEVSATHNYIKVRKEADDTFGTATNLVHEEKLALNKVKASEFLDWYMRYSEDLTMLGLKAYHILRDSGKATLSVVDLFNECIYIPAEICENKENEMISYRTDDVIFVDDITPVELTDHQKMYYYEKDSNW
jgi:hypothetical protein